MNAGSLIITAKTALEDEEKAEALKQVQILTEAGKQPQESGAKKVAKQAMTMLKGIIFGLPAAAAVVEACKELLPTLSKLFGL